VIDGLIVVRHQQNKSNFTTKWFMRVRPPIENENTGGKIPRICSE